VNKNWTWFLAAVLTATALVLAPVRGEARVRWGAPDRPNAHEVKGDAADRGEAEGQGLAWFFECVDCPKQFDDLTDRSLRLDPQGYPHIAFGELYLYYAWKESDGWHREVVDDSWGVGRYAALYLDAAGFAHISYYDEESEDLRYAYQDATGWHIDVVDSEGSVGKHTSLAVNSAGYARISYYDDDNKNLKYAYQDQAGWHMQTLDDAENVGRYTSLALDAAGYSHITYFDAADGDLEYAYQDQNGWHTVTLDSEGAVGGYTSLAIDSLGGRHISYHDATNKALKYGCIDCAGGVGGPLEPIQDVYDVGRYTSIAVDGNNKPHIVFATHECMTWVGSTCISDEPRDLKYIHQDASGNWQSPLTAGYSGEHASLALDSDGKAHASYVNDSNGYLKYANRTSGWWSRTSLEEGGTVGLNLSLELDGEGYAHISYWDSVSGHLQYASRGAGGWSIETVKTSGPISLIAWGSGTTSLALASDGRARISYYTGGGVRSLMYAYHESDGWHLTTADGLENPGSYNSLALDSGEFPHISYHNSSRYPNSYHDLKYIYRDAGGWHPEDVDTAGRVGQYNSLALDGDDHPHISYYDYTNNDLEYATKAGGVWDFHTMDSAGDVGKYTSLALTVEGAPRISYYGATQGDLKFAYMLGSAWYTETVDSDGDVGLYTSLKVDTNGYAHVSYYDKTNGDLKYAYQDASGWNIDIVDSYGDVGMYSSLSLDAQGQVHIGYHDNGIKGLRYAYSGEASYGVSLTPASSQGTCEPGESAAHTLRVTNDGNARDTFDVTVSGNTWTTTAPALVGPLAPGASANCVVVVEVPSDAGLGATDTATVRITSGGDGTKWASATLTTWAMLEVYLPAIVR
jgi:hypothetical protein